jgi:hypothetical protein
MEHQNYLGIYLSKDKATVVCLSPAGRDKKLHGCFTISIQDKEQQNPHTLAGLIARGCADRALQFSEAAIALDCALFMQHNVHSELNDPKQIAATVRFDTEEALAMDITDLAIAFQITSGAQKGSELTVFTAQRKILSELLTCLQSNNIDPVTIEPDVSCLSRFVRQNVSSPDSQEGGALLGILSGRRGYFIAPSKSQKAAAVRTFLLGPTQDREALLARQTLTTGALALDGQPIRCLKVFDSTSSVDHQQLGKKLGIQASSVDLLGSAAVAPQALADCPDQVDFAIAYGAALAHLERAETVDFRQDFMPYQGKKLRLQKTLKYLSVSFTLLLFAVGLYSQAELFKQNKYRSQLRKNLEREYAAVMLGKKPPAGINVTEKLASEVKRIRDVKSGQLSITGEESIVSKLALVLEAFNKCAAETNLNIDVLTIRLRNAEISGDTSSRANTLEFFKAIRNTGLEILPNRYGLKGGRDAFSVTVEPRK